MAIEISAALLQEWPSTGVCILRLNRPDRYNALDRELVTLLRAAVASVSSAGAKVLILAATGPGYCAGADLKERKQMSDADKYAHNRQISALADDLAALPIPTVAAINGLALGGGCELALACDIRFASSDATLGQTEARIGAMPGAGGSQRLPRLIGTARALEMMYSGEPVSASTAAQWGLVNAVVEASELDAHVLSFAQKVASHSSRAAEQLKKVVYGGLDRTLAEGLELERLAITEVLASDDYKEGLTAFAERRQPKFD